MALCLRAGFFGMSDISLRAWSAVIDKARARDDIDEIFFEASAVKSFADAYARSAFHERWLGRYLTNFPQNFTVALTHEDDREQGCVAGYLAGCLKDPRGTDVFSDIAHFALFESYLDRYRAHLHINLAPQFRGAGLGVRLMEAFLKDVSAAGLHGAHVVTGAKSRNVSFYQRCGFQKLDTAMRNGIEIVFLGVRL